MAYPKNTKIAVVILAAGKGTRMESDIPKVLNKLNGKAMLKYVIDTAEALHPEKILVVVGFKLNLITSEFLNRNVEFVLQKEQLGTAHAIMQTKNTLKDFKGDIIILSGDVPLLTTSSIEKLIDFHNNNDSKITIITSYIKNPYGYGRIIRNNEKLIVAIKEEKDLMESEKLTNEINGGIYCIEKKTLFNTLPEIKNNNSQGEYYLPDIVKLTFENKIKINSISPLQLIEIIGINTKEELKKAEKKMKGEFDL